MSKMNCFGCNVEKDTSVLETYPFPEADRFVDEPISPLMGLDCEGLPILNHPNGYLEYRMVVVCHTCFHALDPDMWISKDCWDAINPHIPYDRLPMYDEEIQDITFIKPLPI